MKRMICVLLTCCVILAGCGKNNTASSSSASKSQAQSKPAQSVAVVPPKEDKSSAASQSASTSTSQSNPQQTVEITVEMPVNGTEKKVSLTMDVPLDWIFNGYNVFAKDDVKILEFAAVYPVADPANPITAEMAAQFDGSDSMGIEMAEGFGLQSTTEETIGKNLARTYLYMMAPSDANKLWYPHYTFYVADGYVVQAHFYSFFKEAQDAQFRAVLSSLKISAA